MLVWLMLAQQVDARPEPTTGEPNDVVVTAPRDAGEQYRLRPLPPRYVRAPLPKAEMTVAGKVKAAAEAEAAGIGSGRQSNRLMIRFKLPL